MIDVSGWIGCVGLKWKGYAAHVIDAAKKNKCAVMRIQMRALNGNCSALFGHFCLSTQLQARCHALGGTRAGGISDV